MKSFKILFTFAFVLCFGVSYGQITVESTNAVTVGAGQTATEQMHVNGNLTLFNPLDDGSDAAKKSVVYGLGGTKRIGMFTNATTFESTAFFEMFGTETQNGGVASRAGEFAMAGAYVSMRTGVTASGFGNVSLRLTSVGDLELVTGEAFKPGGGSWAALSDKRAKKDIKAFKYGLEEVMAIKPVFFKYNENEVMVDGEKEYVGVIAQELEEVAPFMVQTRNYKFDDYENGIHFDKEYLSIDDTAIKYMLINAVKTQQADLESKEARISELEARLAKLEAAITKK